MGHVAQRPRRFHLTLTLYLLHQLLVHRVFVIEDPTAPVVLGRGLRRHLDNAVRLRPLRLHAILGSATLVTVTAGWILGSLKMENGGGLEVASPELPNSPASPQSEKN